MDTTTQRILTAFDREVKKSRDLLESLLLQLEEEGLIDHLKSKTSGLSSLVYELSFNNPEDPKEEEVISNILGTDDIDSYPEDTSYYINLNP